MNSRWWQGMIRGALGALVWTLVSGFTAAFALQRPGAWTILLGLGCTGSLLLAWIGHLRRDGLAGSRLSLSGEESPAPPRPTGALWWAAGFLALGSAALYAWLGPSSAFA